MEGRIDVIRITSNVRKPRIQISLRSEDYRCLFQGEMTMDDFSRAITGQGSVPIQIEPVAGKWIGGELGKCSICGHTGCASDIWNGCEDKNYCPNCGSLLE